MFKFSDLHKKSALLPKLVGLKVIKVAKGSNHLFFKFKHTQQSFQEAEFLHPNYRESLAAEIFPASKQQARGISKAKKDEILKVLVPHMPARKAG